MGYDREKYLLKKEKDNSLKIKHRLRRYGPDLIKIPFRLLTKLGGIRSVEELAQFNTKELLLMRRISIKSLKFLEDFLKGFNLKFVGPPSDQLEKTFKYNLKCSHIPVDPSKKPICINCGAKVKAIWIAYN